MEVGRSCMFQRVPLAFREEVRATELHTSKTGGSGLGVWKDHGQTAGHCGKCTLANQMI